MDYMKAREEMIGAINTAMQKAENVMLQEYAKAKDNAECMSMLDAYAFTLKGLSEALEKMREC